LPRKKALEMAGSQFRARTGGRLLLLPNIYLRNSGKLRQL
jgi:hypothetical protein